MIYFSLYKSDSFANAFRMRKSEENPKRLPKNLRTNIFNFL